MKNNSRHPTMYVSSHGKEAYPIALSQTMRLVIKHTFTDGNSLLFTGRVLSGLILIHHGEPKFLVTCPHFVTYHFRKSAVFLEKFYMRTRSVSHFFLIRVGSCENHDFGINANTFVLNFQVGYPNT